MAARRTSDIGGNWAGTLDYRATRLVQPTSVPAVQEAVAAASKVRPLGTRHSFNALADTDDTLISILGIDPEPRLDEAARTVNVGAGIRYGELARWLEASGWALPNLGSLPHISVAGAISTATHGSGTTNLSSAVNSLDLVLADGGLRTLRRSEPDFPGAVVSLGALGIVVRVGLDLQPSFEVRQDVYTGLSWSELLDDVGGVFSSGYSVSIFTPWTENEISNLLIKTRLDSPGDSPPETVHSAVRLDAGALAERTSENQTPLGVAGPWCYRLPHFRLDSVPSLGEEIQTEYFVPADAGAAALRAVRELGPRLAGVLAITELRTVSADDLWLSPAYGQDCLCIHFTWFRRPEGVAQVLPLLAEALRPFAPRPHWGKVFRTEALDVDARYPRAQDFRALAARYDPGAKFRNEFLDQTVWRREPS